MTWAVITRRQWIIVIDGVGMNDREQLLELKNDIDSRFAEAYKRLVGYSPDGLPPHYISSEKHNDAMYSLKDIIAQQRVINELLQNQSDCSFVVEIPKDADSLYIERLLSGIRPLPQDCKAVRK